MLDVTKLPDYVIDDIIANLDLESDRPRAKAIISRMDVRQALDRYLAWNGIIGWSGQILSVVRDLDAAELKVG